MKPPTVLPTLPSLPALDGSEADRLALLAGLSFIEGTASGWMARDLVEWFTTYGSVMGRTAPPASVMDAVVGTIVLTTAPLASAPKPAAPKPAAPSGPPSARAPVSARAPASSRPAAEKVARIEQLPKLLAMSRWRVIVTLRGLLSQPADDRFLQAAIFAERVRRDHSRWVAQPLDTDLLSDIVLSLFVVDILSQRAFHEQNMCVCDVCGRISYNPSATTRAGCGEHLPKTDSSSGYRLKDRSDPPPDDADGPLSSRRRGS